MVRKNTPKSLKENESYILPSPNNEMREFINKFRVDMMEHIVSSIKFAIENKLSIVEVFQFKNSPFVVTINDREFDVNLSHINQYYVQNKILDLCPRIEQLREILKRKINEKKENTDDPNGTSSTSK
jgi:hypothetical protein